VSRFKRAKAVLQASVIALVTAALVFAIVTHVMNRSTSLSKFELTASTNFSISSSLSSSSSTQVSTVLTPGATRYLWYTVHNSLSVPITVNAMSIPSVTGPSGCAASNLDISHTTFGGSLSVPAKVNSTTPGTNSVAVPISLKSNSPVSCQNATFNFTYAGTASYTEVYSTNTVLASSVNPSSLGQAVIYTATVTAVVGANQDPLPTSPTGTVTFKDGSTTICSSVAVTSASTATATAHCSPSAYTSAATHSITALYTNADGNFTTSTSPSLSQVVGAPRIGTTIAVTSTPNPSMVAHSVTLGATVTKASGTGTPTGSVSFYSGTPTGTHTLLGAGTLNASAKISYPTSALPAGTDSVYALYAADTHFSGSTSPIISQTVIGLPIGCTGNINLIGANGLPILVGTNGNDFIYAVNGNFLVAGLNGNDCIQLGSGNYIVADGNGNDVVITGNGNSIIVMGDGNDKITAGNGSNGIAAGDGNDAVTLGNGSNDSIIVGNGTDTVSVGSGSSNKVTLGSGNDTVTIATPGSHDTISGGKGNETIFLGDGTFNTFSGGKGHNVCHLPAPPSSWHGTVAAYYHDTITNCTVVTP
jgi:Ca2+-binding RTX toxin-like protein